MEEILIGSYIKQKRLDNGWSQEYLCENICGQSTLSRIENNERTPSAGVVKTLLQKLGLPAGRFFALLSADDLEQERLEREINREKLWFRRAAEQERVQIREGILEKLEKLEKFCEDDDRFARQFILSTRATVDSCTSHERLDMLIEAIRLTLPRFDVNNISDFQYSEREIILVNQIARTYTRMGDRKKAIAIDKRLLHYIEENNKNLEKYPRQFCLVAHNYAIDLALEKKYKRAIELAEKGKKIGIEQGDYQFLPGFLAIQAECQFFLGDYAQSTELYLQAYYLYKTLDDKTNLAIMKKEMKERLGLEMSD